MLIGNEPLKSINEWLDAYGESHKNPVNKKIHWICVPAIMFSITGLFFSIPQGNFPSVYGAIQINWGFILIGIVITYYLKFSVTMAVGMTIISILLVLGNYALELYLPFALWKISTLIFLFAWIGQFIGHKIEGKKPSFFQDIQFLLIGPAWILSFIFKKFGIKIK